MINIFKELSAVRGYDTGKKRYISNNLFNSTKGNQSSKKQILRESICVEVVKNIILEINKINFLKTNILNETEIFESFLFRNSAFFELTEKQQKVIDKIVNNENDEGIGNTGKKNLFFIEGSAGTGKTVIMNHLIARLLGKEKEILVCVKKNMLNSTSEIFADISKKFGLKNVKIVTWDVYMEEFIDNVNIDYLIIDEAQRLIKRNDNYNNLKYKRIMTKEDILTRIVRDSSSRNIVLLYDNNQRIRPSDIDSIDRQKFPDVIYEKLDTQFRIKATASVLTFGDLYIKSIKQALQITEQDSINTDFINDTDYFKIVNEIQDLKEYIEQKRRYFPDKNSKILSGFTRGKKESFPELEAIWNEEHDFWVDKKFEYEEIGCVHSVQGYDLDFVGVIIGKDIYFDVQKNRVSINKKEYRDKLGKTKVSDEELERLIKNIYYVLLTRGIYGIRVFIEDYELRKYFKKVLKIDER